LEAIVRVFHLTAKPATASHTDWNGCSLDRQCRVWAKGDAAHARALAHKRFWQESTPVAPDRTSPWTDPEMVDCAEAGVLPGMPVPVEQAVFGWDDRVLSPLLDQSSPHVGPAWDNGQNPDPSRKLDQR
jgi:hypothetical protein